MKHRGIEYQSIVISTIAASIIFLCVSLYRFVIGDYLTAMLDGMVAIISILLWRKGLNERTVSILVMPWIFMLVAISVFLWFKHGGISGNGIALFAAVLIAIIISPRKWRNTLTIGLSALIIILVVSEPFIHDWPIWGSNEKIQFDYLGVAGVVIYLIWYLKTGYDIRNTRVEQFSQKLRELHRLNLTQDANLDVLLNQYLKSAIEMFRIKTAMIIETTEDGPSIANWNSTETEEFNMNRISPDLYNAVIANKETICMAPGQKDISESKIEGNIPNVFLGTPVSINQDIYGVLVFTSDETRRRHFESYELEIIELMALNISHLLSLKYWQESRKQTAEELSLSEQRFKSIYHHANVGICVSDLQGKIVMVNPALERMYGYSEEELLESNFYSYSHPDDMEEDIKMYDDLIQGKIDNYYLEKRNITRTDEIINISLTVSSVKHEDDQVRFTISIIEDITSRKQSEDKINELNWELADQIEKLEGANKELESFSYSVSHDLRAPLRAIDGFSKILLEDHSDNFDKEATRLVNVITNNSKKMGMLIEDLLTFSRISRKASEFKDVDPNKIIEGLITELDIKSSSLTVGHLPIIKGERTLIKQVFANLIGNALKFSAKEKVQKVKVDCVEKDDQFEFYVEDNGVGFNMNMYNKLFGVFQRLHSDSEFSGTGVGLSIVQKVIQKHKGVIWAKSTIGEGSTFYFTIPK